MKRFKHFFAALLIALCLAPALPALAATDPFADVCSSGQAANAAACSNPSRSGSSPLTGPQGILTKVTKLISYIAGIASIIIIIVAGMMYVTSGGDPGKISSAKDAVIYALVGLAVVVTAQGIIFFVLSRIG
ncbi:MAG: hypothetical protein ABWX94_01490 [Candidatus Saccharimonadales bacterium]